MSRLSREEKDSLVQVAEKVLGGKEATSISAYGSKVAGYARPDSDYDLIITVRKLTSRVRYRYVEEPVRASALVLEDKLLADDAAKASLGEFVAGRLLNVYEPIVGAELVRSAEVQYKKRVIAEALLELAAEFGEFAQNLVIPTDYFLFDKLRKRAMIYPPALYSYVKTYGSASSAENRRLTLEGFAEAASVLASDGLITLSGRGVKIVGDRVKGRTFDRWMALLNFTTRGVWQYAVHGYAGRVGLKVIKDEAFSKLKRMRERVEPPDELQRPRTLLRLEEGEVFGESESIPGELARLHGLKDFQYNEEGLGQVYATTRMLTIRGASEERFVMKRFADIRAMKWALLGIWASGRKFSTSPQSRLHREYTALRRLRESGIDTPAIIGVSLKDKVLVREYVSGRLLSDEIENFMKGRPSDLADVSRYGRALAKVHRAGFAVGDAKGSNVIIHDGRVFIADLEQSMENGDTAWDIAEFLYYTAKLSLKEEKIRTVAEEFLRGYTNEGGKEAVGRARHRKYFTPFMPFLTPPIAAAIRDTMGRYAS